VLRIESQLSPELEALVRQTIGCCIAVHRTLGPGLLEGIYSRAIALELAASGVPFERERSYPVMYAASGSVSSDSISSSADRWFSRSSRLST
jgi:hypothetical protein